MDHTEQLGDLVLPHVERADLRARLTAFYAAVDEAIAAHKPVCRNRGDCCRFDRYGHKLYVTTLELACFLHGRRGSWRPPRDDACPYQIDGRCTAREHRPLGCRVFFCDPATRDWQGPEYERRLIELRQIGADFGIPYRYIEWLSALHALHAAEESCSSGGIDAASGDMIE